MFSMTLREVNQHSAGKEADSIRRSQALPLSWDIPSPEQIDRLRKRLSRVADSRTKPDRVTVESAALVLLSLQTGRRFGELASLTHRHRDALSRSDIATPGLVSTPGAAYIILENTLRSVHPANAELYLEISPCIVLPMCDRLRRTIDKLEPSHQEQPIVTSDHDTVRHRVKRLLRGKGDWRARTTKATRPINATHRWLQHRLRTIDGGDPALFAILRPSLS